MVAPIPCPKCGNDLHCNSAVELQGLVNPSADPEGKARADLILSCDDCNFGWNAFVPLEDFFDNPLPEAL